MHINYKKLLNKYMSHVISCEGVSLLDSIEYDNILTEEDKRLLCEIEAEVRSHQPKTRMKFKR